MARFDSQINQALRHFNAGRLDHSEQICRQVLRVDGKHAGALHALGLISHARGAREEALACLQQAAALNRNESSYHSNLGVVQQATGQYAEAEASYRRALQLAPSDASTLANLGGVLGLLGRYREAAEACSKSLRLNPNNPSALVNLGSALKKMGHFAEAARTLRIAIQLKSDSDMAWFNLGLSLWNLNQEQEAIDALRRATELNPNNADAFNSLGAAVQNQGNKEEAANCYQRALEINPNFADAHKNYALNLQLRARLDEATKEYELAIRLDPMQADAHFNLAGLLQDEARFEEALFHFEEAARLSPTADYRVTAAMFLPSIYNSRDDIYHWRSRFATGLQQLHQEGIRLKADTDLITTSFYLAYHGLNDVDLQRSVARLYAPRPQQPNAHFRTQPLKDRPIRVGFISRYFWDHTIGKLNAGLIGNLSRKLFEVSVVALEPRTDFRANLIRSLADHYIPCPLRLSEAVNTLAQTEFDILFYTDIGMDVVTRALAMHRFAPVQCTTWGHPETTGMDTIDFFVSSQLLETANAEQHYTEQVIVLPSLPTFYYRPATLKEVPPRSTFGLPDDRTIYLCPQALFKFHPDFDPILAGILRGDPNGELVLITSRRAQMGERLKNRFRKSMPDVADRIRFVDRLPATKFAQLIAVSDVLLDTLHFGGGNTTYEALAIGKPIVTLPGTFMRGRATMACYQKMGVTDCVASSPQEYIDIAVRLGTDTSERMRVEEAIRQASHVLFEDISAVRQLEEFFISAVRAAWYQQSRQEAAGDFAHANDA